MTDSTDIFAEGRAKEAALLERLEREPTTELVGAVHALGAGGGKNAGDEVWTLRFSLDAWRIGGGPVREGRLRVLAPVTESGLRKLMEVVSPYDVVRLRAQVLLDAEGGPVALMKELVGKHATDDELNAIVQRLQEQVLFVDQDFGTFELDRRFNNYHAEVNWNGAEARLVLEEADPEGIARCLSVARSLWGDVHAWDRRIRTCAADSLLSLKNESWLGEAESELTAEGFDARLSVETITVEADGSFNFWFDDGDLFWGHVILVDGNLADGPTGAGIHG